MTIIIDLDDTAGTDAIIQVVQANLDAFVPVAVEMKNCNGGDWRGVRFGMHPSASQVFQLASHVGKVSVREGRRWGSGACPLSADHPEWIDAGV